MEAVTAINLKPVDVAVIGLGAVGGVAVLPLARAGLKVAGIEAGTWMDPKSFKPDELHNNVRGLLTSVPKANREVPTSRSAPGQPTRRGNIHPMMNAIGGTSIHYWAQSWRLKPWDFKTRSEVIRRYGAGALPKGSTLEDWPIGYDDLEPWYEMIEYEVGVSGKAGNLQGKIDPSGNVFEAPRQREYPMPPLRASGFTELMADAARQLGWKPFRPPAAINSEEYKGRPGCAFHGYCNRGGCHISAKNSTAVTTIPAAMKTRNLAIHDLAHVRRIESDANGRVTGVTYIKDQKEYFQPAKVVLVASYTYENSRLLLLSKSKAYSRGLSNNHGQVGRHYFGHQQTGVSALFPFDINVWYGTPAQAAAVDDFADDNYDHSGPRLHRRDMSAAAYRNASHRSRLHEHVRPAPVVGPKWKAFIHEQRRALDFCVSANLFFSLRAHVSRSRRRSSRSAGRSGLPHHQRAQGERSSRGRLRASKNGGMVPRRRRDPRQSPARRRRRRRSHHARLRWHAHGRQSGNQRGRPLRLLPRSAAT